MKAAIATPDGTKLWGGHFGQSPLYLICEFDGNRWIKGELRKNPIAERGDLAHPGEISALLSDCQIYAAKAMGKKSRQSLESKGIITFLKDVSTVDEIIVSLPTSPTG